MSDMLMWHAHDNLKASLGWVGAITALRRAIAVKQKHLGMNGICLTPTPEAASQTD